MRRAHAGFGKLRLPSAGYCEPMYAVWKCEELDREISIGPGIVSAVCDDHFEVAPGLTQSRIQTTADVTLFRSGDHNRNQGVKVGCGGFRGRWVAAGGNQPGFVFAAPSSPARA